MPSVTASRLIAEYGSDQDYKFAGAVQVKTATTLTTTFGSVMRYEPWTNTGARELLKHHPIGVWKELSVLLHLALASMGVCALFMVVGLQLAW